MLREIYCRNDNETGFSNRLETGNAVEALLTKIKMILYTSKGDVLGEYDLGINLERLLFELNFNEDELRQDIYTQIGLYAPDSVNYNIKVDVNFVPGEVRDIAYINIYIDGTKYLGVVVK